MDDFLLSFFYPMMLVLAEILVKAIIKLWESQLKKNRILAQHERWWTLLYMMKVR